jgi:hypothetical protein
VDAHVEHALRAQAAAFHDQSREVFDQREAVLEEHLEVKLNEFHSRFGDKPVAEVQCQGMATDLQQCYAANPGRALECSSLADAFVACSRRAHADYMKQQLGN